MKPIDKVYYQLRDNFNNDPVLKQSIKTQLRTLVRNMYINSIESMQTHGYCMVIRVQNEEILKMIDKCGLDVNTLKHAFVTQWQAPPDSYMAGNPFYHILILLILYGIRHDDTDFQENSATILLSRMWNGRRRRAIPYCKADVMRYAVMHTTGRYVKKYESPMALIIQHYSPSILNTYRENMKENSDWTHRYFSQCYDRIFQIFYSNISPDLKTRTKKARSGLAVSYYD